MTHSSDLAGLASGRCVPEDGRYRLLEQNQLDQLMAVLPDSWRLLENRLESSYRFDDYVQALRFTNLVAGLAEEQNHHPRLVLEYGSVTVQIWTHVIAGLAQGDFAFAAKVALLMDDGLWDKDCG